MGTRPRKHGGKKGRRRQFTRMAFVMRLRELCSGISQVQLQDMTGINHETMRRQLRGISRPTVEQTARICRCFGVTADWLLFGTGAGPARNRRTS